MSERIKQLYCYILRDNIKVVSCEERIFSNKKYFLIYLKNGIIIPLGI